MTSARRNALGMKLHAVNGPLHVAQPHNHAVGCLRGNFKAVRHGGGRNRQRMIARYSEWRRQVFKNIGAVMADIAQLAMHDIGRPHNLAAKGLPDTLVAKADAENREACGCFVDKIKADARAVGVARAWRDNDCFGVSRENLRGCGLVIAHNVAADP